MAFRLLFWRRSRPAPTAGRHTRATALPVPDSTGALTPTGTGPVPPTSGTDTEHPLVAPALGDLPDDLRDDLPDAPPAHAVDLDATAPLPVLATPAAVPEASARPDVPDLPDEPSEPGPPHLADLPEVLEVPGVPDLSAEPELTELPALAVAGVALGFADGASVQLHPDDPRLTSFRAAAAALLRAPEA